MRNLRRTKRDGGSLLAVMLLVMTTAALSTALLAIVRSATREQIGSQEDLSALYTSEAAVAQAVFDLERGGTGNVGSVDQPVSFGRGASFSVAATDLGNDQTSLAAVGRVGHSVSRIETIVERQPSDAFAWGAFGDEVTELSSNARVDSYDSGLGSYASQQVNGSGTSRYANEHGDVGSNADVYLNQNATVWGDARPGPGGTTNTSGSNTFVSGSTLPLANTQAMEPLVIPVFASEGDLVVSGSATVSSGDHAYGSFSVGGSSTLTISGPATLVVDDFHVDSNAQVLIDSSGGPVEIYVLGDFVMSSNTFVGSTTASPLDLTINLRSDNIIDPNLDVDLDEIDFNSNAQLYGTVYAPNAAITINSNFELFGGIIARRLQLDSNAEVHYDEALSTAGSSATGSFRTVCWRVVGR